MPTVYVIEDGPDQRVALEMILRSAGLHVESFDSAESFLGGFPTDGVGCVVVDVRLPGKSGIQLIEELRERGSRISVVVVTGFAEIPDSVQAMRTGAIDFLEKPFDSEHLVSRVQEGLVRHEEIRQIEHRLSDLTAREREVMGLLATGLSAVQIAERLGLSRKTVDVHRGRILTKVKVRNVVELLALLHRLDA